MIIDIRCRLTIPEAGSYFVTMAKNIGTYDRIEAYADGSLEGFFREIGKHGITTAVSVSGNNPGIRIGRWNQPEARASARRTVEMTGVPSWT